MNVTLQNTDAVSGRLTVSVEENDYKEKVLADLKKIGRNNQIPGFRKGHVAIGELQRRFGRQVTSDVINELVYDAVTNYIKENKLNVLGAPVPVEVKELDLKNQKDFTFEFDLALAPELDIKVDKDEKIPYYNIEVSDAMISEQDAAFRKRFGAQVPGEEVEPDALVKGAIIQLNEDGTVKEGDDAIQVVSGILAPMYFVDKDEAAKFAGKKVGDKVVFNPRKACGNNEVELASMLNIDKNRTAEVQGDFEMTISEIIVVRPAEDGEEFFTNVFGKDRVHNAEEYKAALKDMIATELSGNSDMVFSFSARKYFLDKYGDMELPAAVLNRIPEPSSPRMLANMVAYIKAGEIATFTFSGEINIDGDASNETFIVGFLAPRSWNVRQNATVTYREDRYETEVDHKMTVIPDTEQPANYKGMSWSAALKKKYGVRGNVLNDMEWIAFKSDNYSSVNGTIHYTVTIKCNSGKSNLKFRPSFFINHSSDGIGGDEAHYSVKDADDCFEVVEGSGTVIDFCSTHYYQIEPLSALQDDYVTFTFQGDINTNELIKAENVYIEATAYTIEGKIYTVNEKSAKTLMKRETKLPRYNVTLWPGGFFNIPDGETISRIEYIFTNEDGTVSISQSDDSRDNEGEEVEEGIKEPFVFEFQCE